MSRKGEARKILYARPPSDVSLMSGPSFGELDYVGVSVETLLRLFEHALSSMFAEAGNNESLAERLKARGDSVLQTISDEEGRALFDWGNRLTTVGKASKIMVSKARERCECELDAECGAPAAFLIRSIGNSGEQLGYVLGCETHARRWDGSSDAYALTCVCPWSPLVTTQIHRDAPLFSLGL